MRTSKSNQVLNSVSTEELVNVVRERTAQEILSLEQERVNLQSRLSEVGSRLDCLMQPVVFDPSKPALSSNKKMVTKSVAKVQATKRVSKRDVTKSKPARIRNAKSLKQYIQEVFQSHPGQELSTKEILNELQSTDWQTSSTDKETLVIVAMRQNQDLFNRVSPGRYRLVG